MSKVGLFEWGLGMVDLLPLIFETEGRCVRVRSRRSFRMFQFRFEVKIDVSRSISNSE